MMGDDHAVARRQAFEDRRLLKRAHDALARDDMRREARYALALEPHFAARRLDERGDQLEQRRFARAVGADDGKDFVLLDIERDVVDGGQSAVLLGEAGDFESIGAIGSAPPPR